MNGIRLRVPVLCTILTTVATIAVLGLVAPAQATAAPYCGITWGSQPEVAAADPPRGAVLTDLRAGQHACFDRLVVDLGHGGPFDSYRVQYVPEVRLDGSGDVLPVRGGARLQIVVVAPAYDASGNATYAPSNRRDAVNVTGYQTFRQVAWGGSYEGYSTVGLGTRARLPFRVFDLPGLPESEQGARLVIDVAHRW